VRCVFQICQTLRKVKKTQEKKRKQFAAMLSRNLELYNSSAAAAAELNKQTSCSLTQTAAASSNDRSG
jgi:hypothetical protein